MDFAKRSSQAGSLRLRKSKGSRARVGPEQGSSDHSHFEREELHRETNGHGAEMRTLRMHARSLMTLSRMGMLRPIAAAQTVVFVHGRCLCHQHEYVRDAVVHC